MPYFDAYLTSINNKKMSIDLPRSVACETEIELRALAVRHRGMIHDQRHSTRLPPHSIQLLCITVRCCKGVYLVNDVTADIISVLSVSLIIVVPQLKTRRHPYI